MYCLFEKNALFKKAETEKKTKTKSEGKNAYTEYNTKNSPSPPKKSQN